MVKWAVVGLAAMALSACGEERRHEPGGSVTLRVLARPHLSMAPLLIAEEAGHFRAQGIEIETVSLTSTRSGMPSVLRGDLDVMVASPGTAPLAAMAAGGRLRVVADKGRLDPHGCTYQAYVTRPELLREGRLARDGAVPLRLSFTRGSYHGYLAHLALASDGISEAEVAVSHLSGASDAQALLQGRLDLAAARGATLQRLLESGQVVVWRTVQEVLPDGQFSVLMFGPTLLDGDPEVGIRFMTGYLQGVRQYLEGKTDENLEILGRRLALDRQTLEAACWIPVHPGGEIDTRSLLDFQQWALERGLLRQSLALDQIWDPRFVEAAQRRLGLPSPTLADAG